MVIVIDRERSAHPSIFIGASNHGRGVFRYLVGLGSKYTQPFSLLKALGDKPVLRSILLGFIPFRYILGLIPHYTRFAVYNEDGTLYNVYEEEPSGDELNTPPWLSEAEPLGEYVYLASRFNPFLGRVKSQDLI